MFTSRSAVEAYQQCPRYRYNQNFLLGKGVTRVQKSVPLVTGSAVHRGVEHLLNRLRIGQEPDVDTAVGLAVDQYITDVGTAGFIGKQLQTDKQQWHTFNEQKALTEALIRAWAIAELPRIRERYKVLAVERDIEPIEIAPGVLFQAKVDAEFQELSTGDFHNYSLKTCSQWNERIENSYKSDLQGVTEIWAVEEDARRANGHIDKAVDEIRAYADQLKIAPKQLVDIAAYLTKKKVDKQISGIRFCFLVKGQRKVPDYNANDENAVAITYNPLIRGYKNIGPSGIAYAHSWFYPNRENRSGKSALGKGWEPFAVWESDFGVKGWIEAIAGGQIQPECGDVVKEHVVTPLEYFRREEEMEEAIAELRYQEQNIEGAIRQIASYPNTLQQMLREVFPHNRKHCSFHFGGQCEYNQLCWAKEVQEDVLGSGLYQIRDAHHEAERMAQ